MSSAVRGGSVPPPPSTLPSPLPPLPPALDAGLREHAGRYSLVGADVPTEQVVARVRRRPRTPSARDLLAAVDRECAPPARAGELLFRAEQAPLAVA